MVRLDRTIGQRCARLEAILRSSRRMTVGGPEDDGGEGTSAAGGASPPPLAGADRTFKARPHMSQKC